MPTDVTVRAEVEELAEAAVDGFGRIDVWADTAAVMAYGRFEDVPADGLRPGRDHRPARPGQRRPGRAADVPRGRAHGTLILCGSLLGHITAPYMSAYVDLEVGSARRWPGPCGRRPATRRTSTSASWSPGSVDTPIYTSAANYAGFVGRPPPPVDSAERLGAAIVRLADRPRRQLSVGLTNRLIEFGFSALPPVYDALVGPLMGRLALSQRRTGPGTGNVFGPAARVEGGPLRWERDPRRRRGRRHCAGRDRLQTVEGIRHPVLSRPLGRGAHSLA